MRLVGEKGCSLFEAKFKACEVVIARAKGIS